MKRWAWGALVLLLGASAALLWTFTPQRLTVSTEPLGALPKAEPPGEMTLSGLPTGAMHSRAGFAYRGGSLSESRDFTMTAALIQHPRGDLLIDTGFGRGVDAHFRAIPWVLRTLSTYVRGTPAADQLASAGYDLGRLAGVVITHAHWDHVSGLPDLPGVPVWMNADERRFVESGHRMGALMRSFGPLAIEEYRWDGGAYLGFPRSHDVWGDGSVVLVPAPGHTPGSVIVFVALPSGARYAFLGDLVWQREGIDLPAERPWPSRETVDADAADVRENIARVARVHAQFPDIVMVPGHDARASAEMPRFPGRRN
ncbi:MAG TPA: MBL fold metallo-hydrolase [Polyangiaceae bacterium]